MPFARGVVPDEVAVLFPHLAHHGHDVPRVGVDDGDGGLEGLAVPGGHVQVAPVLVDALRQLLDLGVQGGVDVVAAVVEPGESLILRDVVLVLEIPGHIPEHLVHEPGVDLDFAHGLFHDLVHGGGPVGEVEDLRLGGVGLGLGDIGQSRLGVDHVLFGHRIQNCLLALLVQFPGRDLGAVLPGVGDIIHGSVQGGVVCDGDNTGALRQAQVLGVLAKVELGRRLDAAAVLPQKDSVQVQLQDILLLVVLLKLQGPENLPDLPVDIGPVVLCHVFQHLLCDGGPAVAAVPDGQLLHRAQGSDPVHALVLEEPLVLHGHSGLPQVGGHLVQVHQDAVLRPVDVLELLPGPGLLVLVVDEGAEAHGVVLRPDLHVGDHRGLDILLEKVQTDQRRTHPDEQDCPQRDKYPFDGAQDDAQGGRSPALPAPGLRPGGRRRFSSSVLLQSSDYLLCFKGRGFPKISGNPYFLLYHPLSTLKMSHFAEKKFPYHMDLWILGRLTSAPAVNFSPFSRIHLLQSEKFPCKIETNPKKEAPS